MIVVPFCMFCEKTVRCMCLETIEFIGEKAYNNGT